MFYYRNLDYLCIIEEFEGLDKVSVVFMVYLYMICVILCLLCSACRSRAFMETANALNCIDYHAYGMEDVSDLYLRIPSI